MHSTRYPTSPPPPSPPLQSAPSSPPSPPSSEELLRPPAPFPPTTHRTSRPIRAPSVACRSAGPIWRKKWAACIPPRAAVTTSLLHSATIHLPRVYMFTSSRRFRPAEEEAGRGAGGQSLLVSAKVYMLVSVSISYRSGGGKLQRYSVAGVRVDSAGEACFSAWCFFSRDHACLTPGELQGNRRLLRYLSDL